MQNYKSLTAVPYGLGSNPEGMDVCKCIALLRHGGTLNNRQAVSPLVRLEGKEGRNTVDHLQGVLPQNWDGTEPNRTVTYMLLKATANNRLISSPLPR
ncbi:uncharacterized protein TNCV_3123851 [Trichonephila clavipes]|nr:uncharacterized protein TNCV_3123851 [Trichonephila clavipes]